MAFSELDPFALAARKYKGFPGNPERVYRALCFVLSDRAGQVDWEAFSPDDWRIIEPMAATEGVAPLLYWKVRHWLEGAGGAAHAQLPRLVERLAPAYYETLARNTLLLKELERILAALESAGIEVIVLKGAALAQTVYEDIGPSAGAGLGLRPMHDLDLLVRPDDLRRAVEAIAALGYNVHFPPEHRPGMLDDVRYDCSLRKEDVLVELHWRIMGPAQDWREPSADVLWHTPRSWRGFQGMRFRTLALPLFLMGVSAHLLLRHGFSNDRLLWHMDLLLLAVLLEQNEQGISLAEGGIPEAWKTTVSIALKHNEKLFGRKSRLPLLPPEAYHIPTANFIVQKTFVYRARFFETLQRLQRLPWKERARIFLGYVFPSGEYMQQRYTIRSNIVLPVYYVYRWLDILWEILGVWGKNVWIQWIRYRK